MCRKERKEEEESWRHSEKHRAKQSRTKGESYNTNCRSQWPHHKHLLLHPESRQLLAQASKLRFSDSFFWLVDSKARHYCRTRQTRRDVNHSKLQRQKNTSEKLEAKSELILTICTCCCQKKTKVCFESPSLRKGIQHSQSLFSSSLLLPAKP